MRASPRSTPPGTFPGPGPADSHGGSVQEESLVTTAMEGVLTTEEYLNLYQNIADEERTHLDRLGKLFEALPTAASSPP